MSYRALTVLLVGLALLAALLLAVFIGYRLGKPDASLLTDEQRSIATEEAKEQGYSTPEIVDLPDVPTPPPYSTPTRHSKLTVSVRPRPQKSPGEVPHVGGVATGVAPSPPAQKGGTAAAQDAPKEAASGALQERPWPDAEDLGGECTYDELEIDGVPYAKTSWSGVLQGPDGEVLVRRGPVSGDGDLHEIGTQIAKKQLADRWKADLMTGGSWSGDGWGLEAGAAIGGRKHGLYSLVEVLETRDVGAEVRIHAGYRRSFSF